MTAQKISELTAIDVVASEDIIPISDMGSLPTTKRATATQLRAFMQIGVTTPEQASSLITAALVGYSNTTAMNAAIASALSAYSNTTAVNAAITSALTNYSTTSAMNAAIGAALTNYSDTTAMNAAITSALGSYSTTSAMNAAIASALSGYSTTANMNAAISAAVSGKQDTLVAGTSIKTINGVSPLGSGNITINSGSGSPGGSNTQLQFNDQGSFAGSPRLIWTDAGGLMARTTGDNAIVFRISPVDNVAYTHNVPFVVSAGTGPVQPGIGVLAPNVSPYNFGCNLELGGGPGELFSVTQPAIGIRLESNYITNRRGINERFVEYHLTYTPMHDSSNTTVGQHIRFMSTEIGTGFNVNTGEGELNSYINTYMSTGAFDLRMPLSGSQGAIYFAAAPGSFKFSDAAGVNLNAFEITHDPTYTQFSCTGSFIFGRHLGVSSTLSTLGNVTIQSLDAANALTVYGGVTTGGDIFSNANSIRATKSLSAANSLDLFAYSIYGTPTTEPAAQTGTVRQIVRVNGGNLELHAKGPTGATVLIATLPAS